MAKTPYTSAASKYAHVTLDDILALKKGEVVSFMQEYISLDRRKYRTFLLVDHVDLERGVVSGNLVGVEDIGVNAVPIEDLVQGALDIASWQKRERK